MGLDSVTTTKSPAAQHTAGRRLAGGEQAAFVLHDAEAATATSE